MRPRIRPVTSMFRASDIVKELMPSGTIEAGAIGAVGSRELRMITAAMAQDSDVIESKIGITTTASRLFHTIQHRYIKTN